MFFDLKPDFYVCSLEEVPVLELQAKGIQGLIIDLDNTLTNWNCIQIDYVVEQWLLNLQLLGFRICIVSNNGPKRIEMTLQEKNIPFVANALKPRKKGFLKAMELIDCIPKNTAIIGDQLLTDVLGGKLVGILTILVAPRSSKEFLGTKITRFFERLILKRTYR